MSKISLEPNASGAGTFTLAAPNSNTNRTLTLPDEAGKLLSTGNNDPAEVFKQSNILGTASESDGVPTGAIIERGSNANGEYVKYAGGVQVCWFRQQGDAFDMDAGEIETRDWSFPVPFSSRAQGAVHLEGSTSTSFLEDGTRISAYLNVQASSGAGSSTAIAVLKNNTSETAEFNRWSLFAWGRWH